jgi:hypothetical protein
VKQKPAEKFTDDLAAAKAGWADVRLLEINRVKIENPFSQ